MGDSGDDAAACLAALSVYQAPAPLARWGRADGDGGYVVCLLPGGYDALLSGGVGGDDSFERAFLDAHPGAPCAAFDGTVAGPPSGDPRIAFVRANLASAASPPGEGYPTANLAAYLAGAPAPPPAPAAPAGGFRDAFLKMDIEGHEYFVVPVKPSTREATRAGNPLGDGWRGRRRARARGGRRAAADRQQD